MNIEELKKFLAEKVLCRKSLERAEDKLNRLYPNEIEQLFKHTEFLNYIGRVVTFTERVYCIMYNISSPVICECSANNCKNPVNFVTYNVGYKRFCSASCVAKGTLEKARKTNLERYGTSSPVQSKIVQDKMKKTTMERYGAENPFGSKEIRAKIKEGFVEKYGVENPYAAKEVKDKIKETKLERYGDEFYSNRDKVKETVQERYGVDYNFQAEDVKEKIKQTNIEKFGVSSPLQNPEIMEKMKATNRERYGSDFVLDLPEMHKKGEITCLQKYGTRNCLQNDKVREKHTKSCFNYKVYKLPSGREINIQGYEGRFLDKLFASGYEESDILVNSQITEEIGEFWYVDENGKKHRYFPDIYIKSERKVIEVKSNYTMSLSEAINNSKAQSVRDRGFNFEFKVIED